MNRFFTEKVFDAPRTTAGRSSIWLTAALLSAGCASILSGGKQELTFDSDPPGATVFVAGKEIGKTPITASVKREDKQMVTIEKDGYKPFKTELVTKTNSFVWFNALFFGWGVLSSTTDANTGAIRAYAQDKYTVALVPAGAGPLHIESEKAKKIKDFVVVGYRNIQSDITKGSGEYLDSLISLLEIPAADRKDALEKLRALATLYKDIPVFADKLAEQFSAKQ